MEQNQVKVCYPLYFNLSTMIVSSDQPSHVATDSPAAHSETGLLCHLLSSFIMKVVLS